MRTAVCLVLLSVFWIMQTALAQKPTSAQDPNRPQAAGALGAATRAEEASQIFDQIMATAAATDPNLCAIVVLPGPADSFTIRLGVFNVAADRLDVLIMNSFQALEGQALLHHSVFDAVEPTAGTLTVHYPPDEAGKGPVVLGFTEFTQFKSAALSTDPDTYEDPESGVTVQDLDKTVIEAVYADGLRCRGTLTFQAALNASIAHLVQVFPQLTAGLVGSWSFDQNDIAGTTAFDRSGNGNNGTLMNGPTLTRGKVGQALHFDGVDDWVQVADPTSEVLDFGTGSFTYALWVYVQSNVGRFDMPLQKGGQCAGCAGYDMELGSDHWTVNVSDGMTITTVEFSPAPLLDQWVHVVGVRNAATGLILTYLNGALQHTGSAPAGSVSNGRKLTFGSEDGTAHFFHGLIDEVRIYNRALPTEEIEHLYNLGPSDS